MTQKRKTTSTKHRTSSKSGGSEKSRKKDTSRPRESSSRTAPASFDQVFGNPESPELTKLRNLLEEARRRLQTAEATPEPGLALYRTRRQAKIWRQRKHVRDLQEAIKTFDSQDNN